MTNFTGYQWLLIDAANNFGHDKMVFEDRIKWAEDNLTNLEALADQADPKTRPLYLKAVMAIRKAQKGLPMGHMVGVDAVCSGIQVMSVLTGCVDGCRATGLIDPDVRSDAYTQTTGAMALVLGSGFSVSRLDAKDALLTSFYGSTKRPKDIFGVDTPELEAFHQAAMEVAPGAWSLLQDLLSSWQPYALVHQWKLPDGYDSVVKVMDKREARIEVDELDHATFTYEFYENVGTKTGKSNAANVVHSMDAYILRAMHRRCNYDRPMVEHANLLIEAELLERSLGMPCEVATVTEELAYYLEQYNRSSMVDVVILPHLDDDGVRALSTEHLQALTSIINGMLQYKPFPIVTVHDEFKAHPNNVDWVRYQYKEILAELADSSVLDDLLSQLHGMPMSAPKLSFNLSAQIRGSNYGLC